MFCRGPCRTLTLEAQAEEFPQVQSEDDQQDERAIVEDRAFGDAADPFGLVSRYFRDPLALHGAKPRKQRLDHRSLKIVAEILLQHDRASEPAVDVQGVRDWSAPQRLYH